MEAEMEQFVAWLKQDMNGGKLADEIDEHHKKWKAAVANFGEMVDRVKGHSPAELDERSAEVDDAIGAFHQLHKSHEAWGLYLIKLWK